MLERQTDKLLHLVLLLSEQPREFCERVIGMWDSRIDRYWQNPPPYTTVGWETAISRLSQFVGTRLEDVLKENALKNIEAEVSIAIKRMPAGEAFDLCHNGDFQLGRLCYALARITRPAVVVETGVCYGVTSSFLLAALHANGSGTLHSIDLPPLGTNGERFVGRLIPDYMKDRWRLYRGLSQNLLPSILEKLGGVGLFLHDSLHTYRNMHRELEIVTPYLTGPAVVIADDIEGNGAFQEWVLKVNPFYSAVLEEQAKRVLLGLALLHEP